MSDYKCDCNGEAVSKRNVTIRYVEGKGAVHDVRCDECGEYMNPIKKKRNYTKDGIASLGRMNRNGSSY
jgi:formylmethanofuran dehydrogenase subunit E